METGRHGSGTIADFTNVGRTTCYDDQSFRPEKKGRRKCYVYILEVTFILDVVEDF